METNEVISFKTELRRRRGLLLTQRLCGSCDSVLEYLVLEPESLVLEAKNLNQVLRPMKHLIIYTALLFTLFSCKRENMGDCFKGNGIDVTETRFLGRFDSIDVKNNFDVSIESGNEYSVQVTAGKHVIKNISTVIKNGQLTLQNKNTCNFVRGYKRKFRIKITTPRIKKINNDGVGPVTFNNTFKQDTVWLKVENSGDIIVNGDFKVIYSSSHGNGNVQLSGSAKQLLIYTNGTNFIYAENIKVSEQIYISTQSIGDAHFNLDGVNQFEYFIYSDGNIYYTGVPKNMKRLGGGGTGKLIKTD